MSALLRVVCRVSTDCTFRHAEARQTCSKESILVASILEYALCKDARCRDAVGSRYPAAFLHSSGHSAPIVLRVMVGQASRQ